MSWCPASRAAGKGNTKLFSADMPGKLQDSSALSLIRAILKQTYKEWIHIFVTLQGGKSHEIRLMDGVEWRHGPLHAVEERREGLCHGVDCGRQFGHRRLSDSGRLFHRLSERVAFR